MRLEQKEMGRGKELVNISKDNMAELENALEFANKNEQGWGKVKIWEQFFCLFSLIH